MVKEIDMVKGFKTIVDDEDYKKYKIYNGIRWYCGCKGYAVMSHYPQGFPGPHKTIFLHRLINNTPEGMWTDHINGNRLDNRRCNLRTIDRSGNVLNGKKFKTNTVGYRGVYFRFGKYIPRICIKGTRYTLGYFNTAEEARDKRFEFAKEMGVIVLE
jgi:hypothetical protein